jgi:hypothetical protein
MIAAALAAGGTAGVTNTASAAVQDAYTGLRAALRRRLSGRDQAEQALEAQETAPDVWQARLGADLADSGADRDDAVLAAAQRLLTLVEPAGTRAGKYTVDLREAKGVQVGDGNTQHNAFS